MITIAIMIVIDVEMLMIMRIFLYLITTNEVVTFNIHYTFVVDIY